MPFLLHLTDLHLGREGVSRDNKAKLDVSTSSREEILKASLEGLREWLGQQDDPVSGVIVTGDLTEQCGDAGFQAWDEIQSMLVELAGAPEGVLVLPGNHDVRWGTPPGSDERYAPFLQHTAASGVRTAWLEGRPEPNDPLVHCLVAPDLAWAVVPFNSADHCGEQLPMPDRLQELLGEADDTLRPELEAEIRRLLLVDAPRIGETQLALARRTVATLRGQNPDIVLLAACHHQLLPVGPFEEIKSFESLTNLGKFREFLAEHRFAAVLHGHKHIGRIGLDTIERPDGEGRVAAVHRLWLLCGQPGEQDGETYGQFIRIVQAGPAAVMEVIGLGVSAPSAPAAICPGQQYPLWGPLLEQTNWRVDDPSPLVFEGTTADEVYQQAQAVLPSGGSVARNVVCHVANGSSARVLPKSVATAVPQPAEEWLAKTVAWWQTTDTKLVKRRPVQHGARLRAFRAAPAHNQPGTDQLQRVTEILKQRGHSSRAVAVLIGPETDDIQGKAPFPSFCLAQFVARDAGAVTYIDVVGFYRKQDFGYWWPVNVAELAQIGQNVVVQLQAHIRGQVQLGALSTFTTLAVKSQSMPMVDVRLVDRWYDEDAVRLDELIAHLAAATTLPGEASTAWQRLIDDLEPPQAASPDGISVAVEGLQYVVGLLQALGTAGKLGTEGQELQRTLEVVARLSREYDPEGRYDLWRDAMESAVNEARTAIEALHSEE